MSAREIPLVLGTAGHIDHGKTTLVRALTGIDCDRLEEEKRRGITIELGFAPLELPDGTTISVVDVPGHEKFIRQMVAGAAGIDAVLLVVAADEGVMPQTREHLEILELLGIKEGLVALTKVDRVDDELQQLATEDVKSLLEGTFLQDAQILPVSAMTGTGIKELSLALQGIAARIQPRPRGGALFLPVDRVFPIVGFGTVVTGTAYAGSVKVSDEVEIVPSGALARVRSLEVHDKPVQEAFAGQRTAVNLSGIGFKNVRRGDTLCTPAIYRATSCVDVLLKALRKNSEPIKHWQRVRLHMGTSDLIARVSFADPGAKLMPGDSSVAQLVLEDPAGAAYGQGFVIRAYSPLETIGGGQILFPYGWKPRSRQKKTEYAEMLGNLAKSNSVADRLVSVLRPREILSLDEAQKAVQSLPTKIREIASRKNLEKELIFLDSGPGWVVSKEKMTSVCKKFLETLRLFHANEPHLKGMTAEEALSVLSQCLETKVAKAILTYLQENGDVVISENRVFLPGFIPEEASRFEKETRLLLDFCESKGFEMPSLDQAIAVTGLPADTFSNLLRQLREKGSLHVVGGELLLSGAVMEKGIALLKECKGDITLAAFRDLSGTSRKYALPFLEYLDSIGVTRRIGEKRILRLQKV